MIRLLLLAVAACTLIGAEPDARPAREAALAWLPLVDAGKYAESWERASQGFKAAVTSDQWADALKQVRGPLGRFKARTFALAKFLQDPPNAPAGDYFLLQYDSDFENRNGATETIVMAREGKAWRTAGYFIR